MQSPAGKAKSGWATSAVQQKQVKFRCGATLDIAGAEKLSYNSIAEIDRAMAAGTLLPFEPTLTPWVSKPRVFLMTERLAKEIAQGIASSEAMTVKRWASLEADIALFVEGGMINWNIMKWLDPKKFERWELRSVRPRPSLRVLGRFADADVFVGTHVVLRAPLKGKGSLEWELEMLTCEDLWRATLGNLAPHTARTYEGYITENASKEVMK